jgi:hypothetical protein
MGYRPEFDVRRPQPGDAELAAAVRKGISDGAALAAADVARVPGRFSPDSERRMWTTCAHGVPLRKCCKECLKDLT